MAEARLAPGDLDVVAAAIGPGGFTGIRVGLAAARGIALATDARLIGVSGFAAVAYALAPGGYAASDGARLLVALDSRREDLYVELFAQDLTAPLAPPEAVLPSRLPDYVGEAHGSLLIAGDAAEAAAAALQGRLGVHLLPDSAPDALGVVAAALEAGLSGPAQAPVRPLYLRPPDVTFPKPRRMPATADQ